MKIIAKIIFASLLSSIAIAEPLQNHWMDRKVVNACARDNEISLSKGEALLTSAQRELIHQCVKEYRIALHKCAEKAGISLLGNPQDLPAAQIPIYRQCQKQAFSQIE